MQWRTRNRRSVMACVRTAHTYHTQWMEANMLFKLTAQPDFLLTVALGDLCKCTDHVTVQRENDVHVKRL